MVLSAAEVVHQPITTVLSGPAAGALGAGVIASAAGVQKVLTCDGGGTSTDVTVVIDGRPALTTELEQMAAWLNLPGGVAVSR